LLIGCCSLGGLKRALGEAIALFQNFGIPSIFATAHSDRETKRRAEAAKPIGWLEKPYMPAHLLSLVNSALAQDN
jgi:two-component system, response regulator PdtaR